MYVAGNDVSPVLRSLAPPKTTAWLRTATDVWPEKSQAGLVRISDFTEPTEADETANQPFLI